WWQLTKTFFKISILFLVSLFLVAPNIFLHYPLVFDALTFESRSSHLGADNLGFFGNLAYYLKAFGSWTNWIAVVFVTFGSFSLIKNKKKYSPVLFYGALYWILLSVLSLHWERWALPMYITPLFLISIGIHFLWEYNKKVSIFKLFSIILIAIFFLQQFVFSLHTAVRMSFTDTRVAALNYCNQNGITKSNSIYEGYTPFQPQFPSVIFDKNIEEIEDIEYIILSSSMFGRFYSEPKRYENQVLFYESIKEKFGLINQFESTPNAEGIIDQINDIKYYLECLFSLCSKNKYKGLTIEIYEIVK
ncbi:MAG: hypothetical protein R6T91_07730, partial [Bacteroidales bacterium]